jgi:hypothetical protein
MLKYFFFVAFFIIVIGLCSPLSAQLPVSGCDKWRRVPSNVVTFLYLGQDGSATELSQGQMFVDNDKKMVLAVTVRNKMRKPIRSVSISEWRLGGSSSEWLPMYFRKGISQNEEEQLGGTGCDNIPELSKNDLSRLSLSSDFLTTVIVLGVREARFVDGSVSMDSGLTTRFNEFALRLDLERGK